MKLQPEATWTIGDVAAFLRVPAPTLYRWRRYRLGPPAHRAGRRLRYLPDEVRAWLKDQQL